MSDPYLDLQVSGRFRVVECVAKGGMGAVYKAQQLDVDRFVAIKILRSRFLNRSDLVSRFRREARAMSHLSHPNTAEVFFFGQLDDGAMYIVMEYLEGRTMAQTLRHQGPFDPRRLIKVMLPVCGALEEAHEAGIIHRDLKPENVMLTTKGGISDFPKLLDFGLAKVSAREVFGDSVNLTRRGAVFGTPEFMSPEQALGDPLDRRSDVYSLGVLIYEALCGKLPFEENADRNPLTMHVENQLIPINERTESRHFSRALAQTIMRALERDPSRRFHSAAAFGHALADCEADFGPSMRSYVLPGQSLMAAEEEFTDRVRQRDIPAHTALRSAHEVSARSPATQWGILVAGITLACIGVVALAISLLAK